MKNLEAEIKINGLGSYEIFTKLHYYESMGKEFNEFKKLLTSIKNLFEDQFKKQDEFFGDLQNQARAFEFNMNNTNKPKEIQYKIKKVSQIGIHLSKECGVIIRIEQSELNKFFHESQQLVKQFHKFLDEYIVKTSKAIQQDDIQFKQSQEQYRSLLQDYTESIDYYKLSFDDAQLIYNINEQALRYQKIQKVVKSIIEVEQHLQVTIEVINIRRQALCVDLKELKEITEGAFNQIQMMILKMVQKFIQTFIGQLSNLHLHFKSEQKNELNYRKFNTIIPEWTNFNFTSEYEPTPTLKLYPKSGDRRRQSNQPSDLIPQELSSVGDNNNRNLEDWSTIKDEIDEVDLDQSFYSVREHRQLDQSHLTYYDRQHEQFPHFLVQPQNIGISEIIHFPEWVMAYCRQIQENCKKRNIEIKTFQDYLEAFIKLSKRLRPIVISNGHRRSKSNIQNLEWYEQLKYQLGDNCTLAIEELIYLQDGMVNFIHGMSQNLLVKFGVLQQLGITLQNEQAMVFSVLNNQIQDLNANKIAFLRSEGLVVNNRTVSLQKINQNFMNYDVKPQSEIKFRSVIEVSSKSITQVLSELRDHDSRAVKTISDIVDNIQNEIANETHDLMKIANNLQRNFNELTIQHHCKETTMKILQNHKYFRILYLMSPALPQQFLFEHGITSDMDLKFESLFDQLLYKKLPKPSDESRNDSQDQESYYESVFIEPLGDDMRKEFGKQMYFIGTKISIEPSEQIINSYSCALVEKVLLQGRLYVTNRRLFFHSIFNSKDLFFGDTSLNIPRHNIQKIQKRTNAYIFDNSMQLTTLKGKLFFTSFIHRDQAYDLIIKIFAPKEQPELIINSNELFIDKSISFPDQDSIIDLSEIQMQQIQERAIRMIALIPESPRIVIKEFFWPLNSINVRKFYKLILSDDKKQSSLGDIQYQNQLTKMKAEGLGCTNLKAETWSPDPPVEFDVEQGVESLVKYEYNFSTRKTTYTSLTPKSSIPFLPKDCFCDEEQKIYFISLDKLVMDMDVYTLKAPYGDSFYCKARYDVENQQVGIKVTTSVEVVFLKSTIMRKPIEISALKSMEEGTYATFNLIARELEQYDLMNNKRIIQIVQQEENIDLQEYQAQTPSFDGKSKKDQSSRSFNFKLLTFTIFLTLLVYGLYNLYDKVLSKLEVTISMKQDV